MHVQVVREKKKSHRNRSSRQASCDTRQYFVRLILLIVSHERRFLKLILLISTHERKRFLKLIQNKRCFLIQKHSMNFFFNRFYIFRKKRVFRRLVSLINLCTHTHNAIQLFCTYVLSHLMLSSYSTSGHYK